MPRRVLIVSPHFPPVNAPDCQRVRMSLPYLREFGWDAHVLAVDPDYVEGFKDADLARTVPADVPVARVGAVPATLTRRFGFGSLALRAGRRLRAAGDRLLTNGKFDLVYFSTTIFKTMTLGPRWRQRFGVPYMIDLQDPWVSDYYARTGTAPPGGRLRYALAQRSARRHEPRVVRGAAHVIAVSPAYPADLRVRYPDVPADRYTVLPFAGAEADFAAAEKLGIRQIVFDPADGLRHWVYLGRGGGDIAVALRGMFGALAAFRKTDARVNDLRLHFVGTSYAPVGRAVPTVAPVAAVCGVGDLVEERTGRIPYLEGISLLKAADAVMVVGSDDPGYSASKIYPCVLARRPVLAVLHAASTAGDVLRNCRVGEVVGFETGVAAAELVAEVLPALRRMLDRPRGAAPDTDWAAFEPYTAREMTRRQCGVFDGAVEAGP